MRNERLAKAENGHCACATHEIETALSLNGNLSKQELLGLLTKIDQKSKSPEFPKKKPIVEKHPSKLPTRLKDIERATSKNIPELRLNLSKGGSTSSVPSSAATERKAPKEKERKSELGSQTTRSVMSVRLGPGGFNQWDLITWYESYKSEEREQQTRQHSKEQKKSLKVALDEQAVAREKKVQLERGQEEAFAKTVVRDVDKWKQEYTQHQVERAKKMEEERGRWQAQADDVQRRRKEELEEHRREEAAILERMEVEAKDAQQREEQRVKKERESLGQIIELNKQQRHKQIEMKLKEREQDLDYARQAIEMLNKQEEIRQRHLKETTTRQARQYAQAKSLQDVLKEKLDEDERKARTVMDEHERKLAEAERERGETQKKMREGIKQSIAEQLREKEDRKKVAVKEQQEQMEEWRRELALVHEKERAEAKKRKDKDKVVKENLDQQMKAMEEARVRSQLMTTREMAVNKDILKQALVSFKAVNGSVADALGDIDGSYAKP